MKRLLLLLLLLTIFFTHLICDVWYFHPDPELNEGDWRADEYYYYDWEAYNVDPTITSPFYLPEVAHLDAINLCDESDFQPEDGWNLYAANFGEQAGTGPGFPFFALYNKYTGLLRIFMYKTINAPSNYTYMAIEAVYNGNSLLFSLGEEDTTAGIKGLDKRAELGECSFISINQMGTSSNNWYYIDLNVMYDPVERENEPSISVRLYGSNISDIDTSIDLCGKFSTTNVSNTSMAIELGNEIYTHFKDGEELGVQIQNHLNEQYIDVPFLEINPQNEIFSIIAEADIITELLAGSNALYGLYKFLTGGGGGSGVSTQMQLHGNLSGTMETINNIQTTNIFESISGRTSESLYSETMGVLNLLNSPLMEHAYVTYGDITGAHTYRLISDNLDYVINPACGLNLDPADVYVALEYDVTFANGYWSWIEEATGYTYAEILEIGHIDEIGSTYISNGVKTRYCTQFVSLDQMEGLAFTSPFAVNNVALKFRTIMERDDNALADDIVFMTNFDTDLEHIGETDEMFAFINEQQLIPVYEDLIFSNEVIDIENVYSVECGSDLRFENCTVNFPDPGYGINVNHGQLIFNNCQINMNGNFITASGDESEVILETGTVLNMEDCTINLSNQAHLYLEESDLTLRDSRLQLSGASRVNLTDNCQFTTRGICEIIGSTSEYWFDPGEYYNVPFPSEYGAEICVPGDRITIENSLIDFNNETEIKGLDSAKWDGIYFLNCSSNSQDPEEYGHLRGSISDISFLDFENSSVAVEFVEISNIGQMKIHEDSHIYIDFMNYHSNIMGIFASESEVNVTCSSIHNNGGTGLIVTNSFYPQSIISSNIYENNGAGLDIHTCFYEVEGCSIYNNSRWGYASLGTVQNLIHHNTVIYDNGYAELVSIADYFPIFQEGQYAAPCIYDEVISTVATDQYLLMALGPLEEPIDLGELVIETSDENRFYPSLDSFIFNPSINMTAYLLLLVGIDYYQLKDYQMAMETMKDVIDLYPETPEAKKALALLPYISKAGNDSTEELVFYIDQIQAEELQPEKTGAKAVVSLFEKVYEDAIFYYEQIIADPPDEQEQLLAELNEAFCYYKLVNSGERNLPEQCRHKPETGLQLQTIQNDLLERLLGSGQPETVQIPELQILNCKNYPNPFNPETKIRFQLSDIRDQSSGVNPEDIEVAIYNIKGQRVKDLSVCLNRIELVQDDRMHTV